MLLMAVGRPELPDDAEAMIVTRVLPARVMQFALKYAF